MSEVRRNDETGLPIDANTEPEVSEAAEDACRHVSRAYPSVPSPLYTSNSGSVLGGPGIAIDNAINELDEPGPPFHVAPMVGQRVSG